MLVKKKIIQDIICVVFLERFMNIWHVLYQ